MSADRESALAVREDASRGMVLVDLVVRPGAARTEIRGADAWRHGIAVRVAAKPAEGAANAELLRFLAERLGLPPSSIRLLTGRRGRRKTVGVLGLPLERVAERLGLRGR